MAGQIYGWTDLWLDRFMAGQIYGWTDLWLDRFMAGQIYGWIDLHKPNVDEWMRRKSCRDGKWPKLQCLLSLLAIAIRKRRGSIANGRDEFLIL